MYTEYFGLNARPFSIIPDGDDFYLSPQHQAAFNMLEFGVLEQVGITVITGEVGSGKTTLVQHLLKRLDYRALTVALVDTAHSAYGSLLRWIVDAFRIEADAESESSYLLALQNFLVDRFAQGKRTVVIIDEAQNMSSQDLEALRLLTNINANNNQLLQIVLVGQPELLKKFYEPGMSQLAQRVSAEYNLSTLDVNETTSYIRYRLESAGGVRELFDPAAVLAVFYFSAGIPRIINTICDGALVLTYGLGETCVTLDSVVKVVRSKPIGGVHRPCMERPDREAVRENILKRFGINLLEVVS